MKSKKCCPLCENSLQEKAKFDRAQQICQENLEFKNKGQIESDRDDLQTKIIALEKHVIALDVIDENENKEKLISSSLNKLKEELKILRDEKSKMDGSLRVLREKQSNLDIEKFKNYLEKHQR